AAGPEAAWLDVRGMLYCARHETDGHIPAAQLSRIGSEFGPRKRLELARRLVDVGRWIENGDGWMVKDFTDYNPSAQQKEAERAAARERMRRARGNRGRSSDDVRPNEHPNTGDSSGNPLPSPTSSNEDGETPSTPES